MKKMILSFAVIMFSCAAFFAAGFGAQLNAAPKISPDKNSFATGASFSFKTDRYPFVFTFETNYDFLVDSFEMGISADYWLCNPVIKGNWNVFAGIGVFTGAGIQKTSASFSAAPRAVLGTNLTLLDGFLELFVQAAAQPAFQYDFQNTETAFVFTVPVAAGIRLWN